MEEDKTPREHDIFSKTCWCKPRVKMLHSEEERREVYEEERPSRIFDEPTHDLAVQDDENDPMTGYAIIHNREPLP